MRVLWVTAECRFHSIILSTLSSIGDGGFDAFLRNCAQTEPSPILRFCRMVHRMVFIFCAHIGKLYDPKNGKLYNPKNGKLYDPKKWKTI